MIPRWYKPNSFENLICGFESNPSTTVGWTFKHSPIKKISITWAIFWPLPPDFQLHTVLLHAHKSVPNIIVFMFKDNSGTLVLFVMNLNVKGPIYADSPMFSNNYNCLSMNSLEMRKVHSLLLLLAPQCAKTYRVINLPLLVSLRSENRYNIGPLTDLFLVVVLGICPQNILILQQ